jgi:hypothetical protein
MTIYVLYILTGEIHALGCSTSRQTVEAERQAVINRWKEDFCRTPMVWIESCEITNEFYEFVDD